MSRFFTVLDEFDGGLQNGCVVAARLTLIYCVPSSMKPKGGGDPSGKIAEAIKKSFGDFKAFQEKFNDAGVKQFGSGWVWLAGKPTGEVQILSTPNQDSPISQGLYPIFGNDVWEHAYYLKYNNRRPEYLQAWWNVVNWDEINKRYETSQKKNTPELAGVK